MTKTVSITELKSSLLKRKEEGETWAAMGREYDVNPAVLWRIAKESYNPMRCDLRAKLCLPEVVLREVYRGKGGRFAPKE